MAEATVSIKAALGAHASTLMVMGVRGLGFGIVCAQVSHLMVLSDLT